jgi:hypothetical protein
MGWGTGPPAIAVLGSSCNTAEGILYTSTVIQIVWFGQTVILEPVAGHSSTPLPLPTGLQRTLSAGTGSGIEEVLLLRCVPENDCACATAERPDVVQDGERVIMSQAGGRRRWPADASLVADADRARSLTVCRNPAPRTAGPPAQANLQTKVARQRATQLACTAGARCSAAGVCAAVAHSLVGIPGPCGLLAILIPWLTRFVRCFCPRADRP